MQANNSSLHAKKLVVGVIGSTILLIGLVLLILPGPGFIVIIIGLGILATEFVWAKRLLERAKNHYEKTKQTIKNKTSNNKQNNERSLDGRTN